MSSRFDIWIAYWKTILFRQQVIGLNTEESKFKVNSCILPDKLSLSAANFIVFIYMVASELRNV